MQSMVEGVRANRRGCFVARVPSVSPADCHLPVPGRNYFSDNPLTSAGVSTCGNCCGAPPPAGYHK